jgi:adhesin HecA-like repeat protein
MRGLVTPAFRVILLAAGCLGGFQGSAHAGTILIVDSPSTAAVGDTVTVDVDVSGVTDLYAFQFDLSFDPTILAAESEIEGTFLPGGGTTFFIPGTIDNVGGTIAATADTLLSAVPGVSGDGTLAVLTFTAIGTGTSPLTTSNAIPLDSGLNEIDFGLAQGSIIVGGSTAVPEPASISTLAAALAMVTVSNGRRLRRTNIPVHTTHR